MCLSIGYVKEVTDCAAFLIPTARTRPTTARIGGAIVALVAVVIAHGCHLGGHDEDVEPVVAVVDRQE